MRSLQKNSLRGPSLCSQVLKMLSRPARSLDPEDEVGPPSVGKGITERLIPEPHAEKTPQSEVCVCRAGKGYRGECGLPGTGDMQRGSGQSPVKCAIEGLLPRMGNQVL